MDFLELTTDLVQLWIHQYANALAHYFNPCTHVWCARNYQRWQQVSMCDYGRTYVPVEITSLYENWKVYSNHQLACHGLASHQCSRLTHQMSAMSVLTLTPVWTFLSHFYLGITPAPTIFILVYWGLHHISTFISF